VGGGFLDVAERDAGVERGGNKGVPEGMWSDVLGQSGAAGDPAGDSPGSVPVQPAAGGGEEDGSFAAFADGEVDRPRCPGRERDNSFLAAFAGDGQGAVAALDGQGLDVGAGRLRRPAVR
jgi:hypothetical protein